MKKLTNLFTYGSLMFAPVWGRVVKGTYASSEEELEGFARYQVLGEEYPAVLRSTDVLSTSAPPSSLLTGRVYWNIDEQDQARLDAFDGSDYERIKVTTRSQKQVDLYLYRHPQRLSQTAWDPVWFERQGMTEFLKRYPGFD